MMWVKISRFARNDKGLISLEDARKVGVCWPFRIQDIVPTTRDPEEPEKLGGLRGALKAREAEHFQPRPVYTYVCVTLKPPFLNHAGLPALWMNMTPQDIVPTTRDPEEP